MFNKNLLYILTILEAIEKIGIYSKEFSDPLEFFEANEQMNFNATLNLLIAIGEEAKKIDNQIKQSVSEVQWSSVIALRNELSHNYRGVDYHIIWSIIQEHLGDIKRACIFILKELDTSSLVLKEIIASRYYDHLTYLLSEL